MSWKLDHVFFATADADSVERALAELGLAFTERHVHRGQGTANACAIFENAFFEILRPYDLEELRSDIVRPLGLSERIHWPDTGACPIGLCFRCTGADADSGSWPFETWGYEAAYVLKGTSIPIVTPAGCLADPLVFVTARSKSAGKVPAPPPDTPRHLGARRTLTRVEVHRPISASVVSAGVHWFLENGFFSLKETGAHALELELDHGREGRSHQFQTGVPIRLRW